MRLIKLLTSGLLLMLISCKQEYQCICRWEYGPLAEEELVLEPDKKITEKKAKEWCDANNETVSETYGECELY